MTVASLASCVGGNAFLNFFKKYFEVSTNCFLFSAGTHICDDCWLEVSMCVDDSFSIYFPLSNRVG